VGSYNWKANPISPCLGAHEAHPKTTLYGVVFRKLNGPLLTSAPNKAAAKELLLFLSQKPAVAKLVEASFGYDLPAFASMYDFDTWKTVGPPVGTVYGYPPRGDEQTSIAGAPARTDVGAQIYNQAINTVMVAKFTQGGEKLDDVLKWVENELEGTLRA
jgi:ABC-type glycerol-3-phosphate transport system substrate-binding protein